MTHLSTHAPVATGMASFTTGLFVGLLVSMTSCATRQPAISYERIDQRKQEIAVLWGQIREWRQSAGLKGVEPPRGEIIKMQGQSVSTAKQSCPDDAEGSESEPCKDVCSLAEAICENAESICRIADELTGDSWAKDKCSSAKASCKEAKQSCCRCQSRGQQDAWLPTPSGRQERRSDTLPECSGVSSFSRVWPSDSHISR